MNVETLLRADARAGRVALAARVALRECDPDAECPRYFEALDQALADEPPPFDTKHYADIYRQESDHWEWMALSLITNAEREGDGAKRLWSLSACSSDSVTQQLLKRHAVDESRHALLYLAMLDLSFPGKVDPAFRADLSNLSPHYGLHQPLLAVEGSPYAKNPTIDDFLQMNIAEIRTTIHHIMQRPALARHYAAAKRKPIEAIQNSLLRDELKHVSYTAILIERLAATIPSYRLADLFRRRLHNFNQITLTELSDGVFDCSVECCSKHSGCRPKSDVPSEDVVPLTQLVH